jgi:hypothetical protein
VGNFGVLEDGRVELGGFLGQPVKPEAGRDLIEGHHWGTHRKGMAYDGIYFS